MKKIKLVQTCNITTGKLDSNAAVENGIYPYFTCAPEPLRIDSYSFDDDVILLAGNNASGNFHCQRYNGKFNAYQRTYVITAKDGYNIDFIFYSLLINLRLLKGKAQGSQTKFLTMQLLDDFEIDDISYEEQTRISKVLSNLDCKINNNNNIDAELEAMAKTIFDYWFLQFEFPNEEGKPYKSSGGKMVWNEELKREIPKGWTYCQLAMISKIKAGGDKDSDTQDTFDAEHSVPVYANGGENKGLYGYTKVATVCKPCVTVAARGTIGLTFLRMEPFMPIIRLICVIPNDIEYVKFLEISLNSIEYKKDGSIQQQLTIPQLSDYKFIIPKIEIMRKFHKLTMDFQRKIIEIEKENQELALLRDFLLPMLMNGQVGFKEE